MSRINDFMEKYGIPKEAMLELVDIVTDEVEQCEENGLTYENAHPEPYQEVFLTISARMSSMMACLDSVVHLQALAPSAADDLMITFQNLYNGSEEHPPLSTLVLQYRSLLAKRVRDAYQVEVRGGLFDEVRPGHEADYFIRRALDL
jgi:hypothetical protein